MMQRPLERVMESVREGLRRLAKIAFAAAAVLVVVLTAAAWRLSQGPIELGWITPRLEVAVNAAVKPLRLSIGGTALAWEGVRFGLNRPLDLRLSNVQLTDAAGVRHIGIPSVVISLSLYALLLGRVRLRALELDKPHLTLLRMQDGTLELDLGVPADQPASAALGRPVGASLLPMLAALTRPSAAETAPAWLRRVRRMRISDAAVTVSDRTRGATGRCRWQASTSPETRNAALPPGSMCGSPPAIQRRGWSPRRDWPAPRRVHV